MPKGVNQGARPDEISPTPVYAELDQAEKKTGEAADTNRATSRKVYSVQIS